MTLSPELAIKLWISPSARSDCVEVCAYVQIDGNRHAVVEQLLGAGGWMWCECVPGTELPTLTRLQPYSGIELEHLEALLAQLKGWVALNPPPRPVVEFPDGC